MNFGVGAGRNAERVVCWIRFGLTKRNETKRQGRAHQRVSSVQFTQFSPVLSSASLEELLSLRFDMLLEKLLYTNDTTRHDTHTSTSYVRRVTNGRARATESAEPWHGGRRS